MDENLHTEILENLFDGVYYVDKNRRITYWNHAAEEMTGFNREEVVGHLCAKGVLQHVDTEGTGLCDSGCPLHATIKDGKPRERQVFLHHKEGYRVPVIVRSSPIRNEEGEIVGAVEMFRNATDELNNMRRMKELEEMAYIDPLTGLPNRRFVLSNLESRLDEYHRFKWPFGLLFIDIDHFKEVNDTYGHDIGDEVLKMVAATLQGNVRNFDLLGRYGGEEFLCIVANVSGDELKDIAERFRMLVKNSVLRQPVELSVTISIGATEIQEGDNLTTLIKRADINLYEAKKAGRNRVVSSVSPAPWIDKTAQEDAVPKDVAR